MTTIDVNTGGFVGGRSFDDTLVLTPGDDSYIQVTVPLATSVLAVGYVSC